VLAWSVSAPLTADSQAESVPPLEPLAAGPYWAPLKTELDIQPGSALDFSRLKLSDGPGGKQGRVVARLDGQFAFAQSRQIARRFCGVNLCFGAQYLPHAEADLLADPKNT
jgi:hypothetical protein